MAEDLVQNVKSYGANGDGRRDDTRAIQSTIDACAAAGGGVVWFPVGRYKTTNPLLAHAGSIALVGTGYGSVLVPHGSFDTVVFRPDRPGKYIYGNRIVETFPLMKAKRRVDARCMRNASPSLLHVGLQGQADTMGSSLMPTIRSF